ncbi:right-handed parallel beta-helix repeat-containing protein [Streptomyces sp. NPDC086787]|uniref:right-handed parallel beta-helix repeat-containing protein n=1 Tax=Streptomyces sp. NPDC086787 TaxID=3365759 RepID=UPI00381DD4E1
MSRAVSRPLAATVLAAAAVAFPAAVPAHAAPITCGDIAALKTAIMAGGTIDLVPYCVYVLTAADSGVDGLPAVTSNTVINGNHATIMRDPTLTSATPFRILRIASGGSLTVSDLTVMNGLLTGVGGNGGGIRVENGGSLMATSNLTIQGNRVLTFGGGLEVDAGGAAELTASLINDNTATSLAIGLGGGAYSRGSLRLHGTVVSSNRAGEYGGGVGSDGSTFVIDQNSRISNNRVTGFGPNDGGGGGVYTGPGGSITDSSVTNNTLTDGEGGGGIYSGGGPLTVTRSTISGNTLAYNQTPPAAGAALLSRGSVTLDSSTVASNKIVGAPGRGAGLAVLNGSLTLQSTTTATTVRSNLASGQYSQGGGIYAASGTNLTTTGATITANKASGTGSQGGGLFNNGGTVSLDSTTSVTSNSAATAPGGIWTSTPFATTATISGNIPTNCLGSPTIVTGCAG